MLDADVVGHLSGWGAGGRRRQADREVALRACLDDLDRVLPLLPLPEEVDYFRRLREIAAIVLRQADGDVPASDGSAAAS